MEYNAQNANTQQPPVQPAAIYSPALEAHKRDARTAMILGIIGAVLCWYPIGSVAGIVLGALALSRSKKARAAAQAQNLKENGMNVAGYVCGLIAVIAGSVLTLIYLFFLVIVILGALYAVNTTAYSYALPNLIESLEPYIESALPASALML